MRLMASENGKSLIENFVSLTMLQGINLIMPLITFPYLFRILGVDNFGLISLCSALIGYFNIFVSFGFELSATKQVYLNENSFANGTSYVTLSFSYQLKRNL